MWIHWNMNRSPQPDHSELEIAQFVGEPHIAKRPMITDLTKGPMGDLTRRTGRWRSSVPWIHEWLEASWSFFKTGRWYPWILFFFGFPAAWVLGGLILSRAFLAPFFDPVDWWKRLDGKNGWNHRKPRNPKLFRQSEFQSPETAF